MIEEPDPNPPADPILGWFGDSLSYFPTFFDDPYDTTEDFTGETIWADDQGPANHLESELTHHSPGSLPAASHRAIDHPTPTHSSQSQLQDLPKKRKSSEESSSLTTKNNSTRKASSNKKGGKSSAGNSNNGGGSKEGRWAEQLLNPCAAAIAARNSSRVHHFFYVLQDLGSLSGDANHRLAFLGLEALKHHLSTPSAGAGDGGGSAFALAVGDGFAASGPRFFRDSLIKFNDISPWFRIPNNVANTSILQILSQQQTNNQRGSGGGGNLHIVDIGVSHGVQWPTLLEELTRRPGGPPPLVRLTVVGPSSGDGPFASGPPAYDFASKLLSFAKDMNINLQIQRLERFRLMDLSPRAIGASPEETLVVCAQFRLHSLSHDDRAEFLKVLRGLQPKGVVLSENNVDCSCGGCSGDFAVGFSRRVEQLWRFLDSTSAAYKGRESDERKMMESEAARVLVNAGEMNERKEKWCERMRAVGFRGEAFGEDTVDGARALLRKYDGNWEIKVEEIDGGGAGAVELWWKGQPVSFCSLWKTDV